MHLQRTWGVVQASRRREGSFKGLPYLAFNFRVVLPLQA